jgi:long-chain acyl-CoA synthetase
VAGYTFAAVSAIVGELDQEEIIPWAREQGPPEDIPALVERDGARELIQAELDRVNAGSAKVQQVKKFTLLDHDLSQEAGELTPTLKLKRSVVSDRYADRFEAMYR